MPLRNVPWKNTAKDMAEIMRDPKQVCIPVYIYIGIQTSGDVHSTTRSVSDDVYSIKPRFHRDAKLLASGNFALPNAKDSTFALPLLRWMMQIFRFT